MGNQCCHDSDSSEYPKPTPNCIPPRISHSMRASTSPSRIAFYGNHSPRIRLYSFLLGTADLNSPVYRLRGIEGLLECIAVYIRRDNAVFNAWWTLPKEYWPAETLDWCDQTDFRRVTICDRYRLTSGPLFAWKLRVRLNPDPPAFMGLSECSFWRWTKEEGYATQLEQHYGSGIANWGPAQSNLCAFNGKLNIFPGTQRGLTEALYHLTLSLISIVDV